MWMTATSRRILGEQGESLLLRVPGPAQDCNEKGVASSGGSVIPETVGAGHMQAQRASALIQKEEDVRRASASQGPVCNGLEG